MKNDYNFFEYCQECQYPTIPPYNPHETYPEIPFGTVSESKNDVYGMIREILHSTGLDKDNYGTKEWNPLGEYIKPGNTVLLKPNMVCHNNPAEDDIIRGLECMITHPSVVRCVFDYVYIALKGKGKIIIADAPVQGCDFDKLLDTSGYGELFCFVKKMSTCELFVDIADLRETIWVNENGISRQYDKNETKYGSHIVDLAENSYFDSIRDKSKFRVTCYSGKDTVSHHSKGKNEYSISDALLMADVVINLPKPKTHRIAGYTAALKNMIGINSRKEYLPHHQKGTKENNGDEYTESHRLLKWINSTANDFLNIAYKKDNRFLSDVFNNLGRFTGRRLNKLEPNRKQNGMWYGNDTIWRTILDINKIVYFCDKEGKLCETSQRIVLHLGDMIGSGEKEGPLNPTYKYVGGIIFSDNPIAFDLCVVKLMGFDYKKFPTLFNALKDKKLIEEDLSEIKLCSNDKKFDKYVNEINDNFSFEPTRGWKEYL